MLVIKMRKAIKSTAKRSPMFSSGCMKHAVSSEPITTRIVVAIDFMRYTMKLRWMTTCAHRAEAVCSG
jgi:hypothetical protein